MSMKIKRLEIEGYKSLKHVVWEPGNLNVLIGPNGSGKSNLLRILEILSLSAQGSLAKALSEDENTGEIFWDDKGNLININLRALIDAFLGGPKESTREFDYRVSIEGFLGAELAGECLEEIKAADGAQDLSIVKIIEHDAHSAKILDKKGSLVTIDAQNVPDYETLLSATRLSLDLNPKLFPFRFGLSEFIFYKGLDTRPDANVRKPIMTHHEEKLRADGQNLISFLNTQYTEKRDFKTEIDTAMRAAFGSNFEELVFTPAADQYIQMRVRWKDLEWPQPTGVLSDGTLRFLYLTAALASPNPPSLIAIDEPETGLHPSMFPIIAELAADAAERTQVVLTTHSPEFLNAFDDTIPTVTVFDWHDGETEMRKVSGDRLKYWLEKYKLGELFRDGDLEAIS